MERTLAQIVELSTTRRSENLGICIGQLVQITESGRALVDFPGNQYGPVEARSAMETQLYREEVKGKRLPVLLVFENGNQTLPIIIGMIRDTVVRPILEEVLQQTERPREAMVDKKTIVFDAEEEIVLRCGKGSITLRKDGKIVLKGTEIVSRASRRNKVKGASVAIN